MPLRILTIEHPEKGTMHWYFEGQIEYPDDDFSQAVALAKKLGIYVSEDADEMISEFHEFENCMREDGLLEAEDSLTIELRELHRTRTEWRAAQDSENTSKLRKVQLEGELQRLHDKLRHLFPEGSPAKIIDNVVFVREGASIISKEIGE